MLKIIKTLISALSIVIIILFVCQSWIYFKKKRMKNIRYLLGIFCTMLGSAYCFQTALDINFSNLATTIVYFGFACLIFSINKQFPNE